MSSRLAFPRRLTPAALLVPTRSLAPTRTRPCQRVTDCLHAAVLRWVVRALCVRPLCIIRGILLCTRPTAARR